MARSRKIATFEPERRPPRIWNRPLDLDQECLIGVPAPLGMDDPTDEKPCQREETKPSRLAEFRQTLEDYARDLRAIINKFRRKLN
jgi:hypothetical protein